MFSNCTPRRVDHDEFKNSDFDNEQQLENGNSSVATQTGSSYICESVTDILKITMDTWVFDHIDGRKYSRPFRQPSRVEIADKTRN